MANTQGGELTLVLGVDGSGKSTFLKGLHESLGVTVLEPTSTPEAKAFKSAHIETPVDATFVDNRENIFLELNRQFDRTVKSELDSGRDVATTGNGLVTLVSHGLMRVIISEKSTQEVDDAVERWLESDSLKSDCIVLVHAPDEVIRKRIEERQQAGDQTERFWGFNSPYFLSRYQETWHGVLDTLSRDAMVQCVTLDSSQLSPNSMIEAYASLPAVSEGARISH